MSRPNLFLISGFSGSGKTTILRYLLSTFEFETSQKFTTRPSRGTIEDENDFIFSSFQNFPSNGLYVFQSYDDYFGIQLQSITDSLSRGISHVLVVDGCDAISYLSKHYASTTPIFVYCKKDVLRERVMSTGRKERWPSIEKEFSHIQTRLDCAEYVVNSGISKKHTFKQIQKIIEIALGE